MEIYNINVFLNKLNPLSKSLVYIPFKIHNNIINWAYVYSPSVFEITLCFGGKKIKRFIGEHTLQGCRYRRTYN